MTVAGNKLCDMMVEAVAVVLVNETVNFWEDEYQCYLLTSMKTLSEQKKISADSSVINDRHVA